MELYFFLASPSICLSARGHSNSVIFNRFLLNFICGLIISNSSSSSNTGFSDER